MKELRRTDLWVGRSAALVGLVGVLLASLWPMVTRSSDSGSRRTGIATVVRCPDRSRMRGAAIVAAICVTAIAAALLVTVQAIASGPDDWALPLVRGLSPAY